MLVAAEPWRAADQPELKRTLEHAPLLETESLGEPARGLNVWERWMVPNPDGQTWDVLQMYFKEYRGPTWLYAFDLGTGEVKRQRLPDNHQFYLSGRALGFDGKYYIANPSYRTWSMDLFVYDPATNTLEERGEIVPGPGGEVRPLATGPDGRIYGTGTRGNRVGLYIYDPELRKVVKDFGPVGPSHPNGAWSRYVMGVDDTHAYIASGMIPAWYLVAVNLQTGEEQVLLESPTERVMDIAESFPGAWAIVPQEPGSPRKKYWLYHGQAIPRTGDTPPWPPKASPWDKGSKTKPQVYFDQIDSDADGHATLWYRTPEDAAKTRSQEKGRSGDASPAPQDLGWKAIHVQGVETYLHRINPMTLLPAGRLYGVDVSTGEVLLRKTLPSPVSTDAYWPHWVNPSYEYESLTLGPDGFVWTCLKDVMVRIDPKDVSLHVVGRIAPVGYPTFVGKDLYLSGPEQLRRIRKIAPAPKPWFFRPGSQSRLGTQCREALLRFAGSRASELGARLPI